MSEGRATDFRFDWGNTMRDPSKRKPNRITELLRSGGGVRAVQLILCLALFAAAAVAQSSTNYRIDTIVGGGVGDGGSATQAHLTPLGMAADRAGNLYVADTLNHRVRRIDTAGGISTFAGTVGFLGSGSGTTAASPVILALDDASTGSDFDYSIPPRSSQRFTTANPFGALNAGSVRAVPDSGNATPSSLVVFSYAPAGKTLPEAGVPALPKGSAFRVYAEASGTPGQMGSISTGLAITNVGNASNTVTLEVARLDGSLAAAPEMLTLPPSGQVARFLNDIFSLPDNFSRVLRVTSTADIAIVALRLRVNENGEIKVTMLAPSNEMDPSTSEDRHFAHFADSGGWSTQFILFSGTAGQAASGTLSFIDASGQPLDLSPQS